MSVINSLLIVFVAILVVVVVVIPLMLKKNHKPGNYDRKWTEPKR